MKHIYPYAGFQSHTFKGWGPAHRTDGMLCHLHTQAPHQEAPDFWEIMFSLSKTFYVLGSMRSLAYWCCLWPSILFVSSLGATWSQPLGDEYTYIRNAYQGHNSGSLVLALCKFVKDNIVSPLPEAQMAPQKLTEGKLSIWSMQALWSHHSALLCVPSLSKICGLRSRLCGE